MIGGKNTEIFVGVVIHAERVGESDVRIRVLSMNGLRNFTLTGAQKSNAKLKVAGQLFCVAEFSIIGHRVVGAHVLETNHAIVADIKRYYLACAICEVASKCEGAGFARTIHALGQLANSTPSTPSVREIYTEYFTGLLGELGYGLEENRDINGAWLATMDIKIPNTKEFLA